MKYMLTITDQATGRIWVYFSRDKKRIVDKVKAWVVVAEAECREYGKGEKVKAMRFDRGREFLNEAMKEFCAGREIRIETTVGYQPEGNSIAERSMRTISERGNAMRHEMDLPDTYWEFANAAAAYLRNRGVVKNMTKSPWELWRNQKPSARHLRVFGCPAWVLIPKEKRTKLAKRAWQGIFVGYKEETDKIYLVWDPTNKKVHEVWFVEFDESKFTEDITRPVGQLPGDEKEKDEEQGESADDKSDTEDQSVLQEVEAGEEEPQDDIVSVATREEIADVGSTEPDTLEIEDEGLQGDTIVVDCRSTDNAYHEHVRRDMLIA